MDQTFLLVLGVALVVALAALGRIATRRPVAAGDSPFASSTEGMKVCPKCAMGNLWTERTCISCGTRLRG